MRFEMIYSSLDLLVASCNRLAKAHNVREDGVFTVDMLRSKLAIFLATQQNEDLVRDFSKYVLESVERDEKIIEEKKHEQEDIQGHPI